MISKKMRNISMVCLSLVLALTLAFGLSSFSVKKADAATINANAESITSFSTSFSISSQGKEVVDAAYSGYAFIRGSSSSFSIGNSKLTYQNSAIRFKVENCSKISVTYKPNGTSSTNLSISYIGNSDTALTGSTWSTLNSNSSYYITKTTTSTDEVTLDFELGGNGAPTSGFYKIVVGSQKCHISKVTITHPIKVTFNDAGEKVTEITTNSGTFTFPSAPANVPEGKVFAGWKDSNGNLFLPNATTTVSQNTTYTAQWDDVGVVYYQVKFISNDVEVSSTQVKEGANITFPAAPTAPSGKKFNGWKDLDGNSYQAGDVYENVSQELIFYADWVIDGIKADTYNFSAECNISKGEEKTVNSFVLYASTDVTNSSPVKYNDNGYLQLYDTCAISFYLERNALVTITIDSGAYIVGSDAVEGKYSDDNVSTFVENESKSLSLTSTLLLKAGRNKIYTTSTTRLRSIQVQYVDVDYSYTFVGYNDNGTISNSGDVEQAIFAKAEYLGISFRKSAESPAVRFGYVVNIVDANENALNGLTLNASAVFNVANLTKDSSSNVNFGALNIAYNENKGGYLANLAITGIDSAKAQNALNVDMTITINGVSITAESDVTTEDTIVKKAQTLYDAGQLTDKQAEIYGVKLNG